MIHPKSDDELLSDFFGAYFHQDWDMEADDYEGIVALYLKVASPENVALLRDAVLEFAQAQKTDEAIEQELFQRYGCYYTPSGAGLSARAWLMDLVALLSKGN